MKKIMIATLVGVSALGLAACTDKAQNKIENAADQVGDDMGNAADDAGNAMSNAADDVANAVDTGTNAAANGAAATEAEIQGTTKEDAKKD